MYPKLKIKFVITLFTIIIEPGVFELPFEADFSVVIENMSFAANKQLNVSPYGYVISSEISTT
jgi:hypothetical protein